MGKFDGIFEFIDKLTGIFGNFYDKGYLFYIIFVGFILLTAATVLIIYLALSHEEPYQDAERDRIIAHAPAFCDGKGFNGWGWVNESAHTFNCTMTSKENKSDISGYFYQSAR